LCWINSPCILAFNRRFDKKDTFAFLENFGEDCAGALSIIPESEDILPHSSKYRCIDVELQSALQTIESNPGKHKLYPELANARLSIAGAQDKLPVYFDKGSFYLPLNSASPTTHIIKPASPYFHDIQRNEAFCMDLARQVGLSVPHSELYTFAGHELFLIERYDRLHSKNRVKRIHQEDFCQALGYGHEKKYQEHGGPSFAQCYRLVQEVSSEPVLDTQDLLRWQIFNVLAGNSDGHAKNLSLLHLPDGETRLAPFYDLVCTRAIERIDYHLAFDVGGERNPGVITKAHWDALAIACDVRPRFLGNLVEETATRLQENLAPVRESFEARFGAYPALQRIEQIVTKQCRHVTKP